MLKFDDLRLDGDVMGSSGAGSAVLDRVAASDPFERRFRSLTARELRLFLLIVEGEVAPNELSSTLGVSRAAVTNSQASIRRKLAVPPGEDLQRFVQSVPQLRRLTSETHTGDDEITPPNPDPRRKDVLRVTVKELESLTDRARRRARAMRCLPHSDESLHDEAQKIEQLAAQLESTLGHVLATVRESRSSS